jgi:hypothetical protein
MAATAMLAAARAHSQVCGEVLPDDVCLTSVFAFAGGPYRFGSACWFIQQLSQLLY